MISLENLKPEESVSWVAFYGAPLVQIEKLPGGIEVKYALNEMSNYIAQSNKKISALISAEIGGLNSIIPLLIASERGLPVLDGDLIGRAFPELQMATPFIYGIKKPFPISMADDCENCFLLTHIKDESAKRAENFFRHMVGKLGLFAGIASDVLSKDELNKTMIKNSLSKAWELGKAVYEARTQKTDFIETLIKNNNGKKIFEGKIHDVTRNLREGYTKGQVVIAGLNDFLKKL